MRAAAVFAVMLLGDLLIGQETPPGPTAELLIEQSAYSILWFSDPAVCVPCRELVPTIERMRRAGYPITVLSLNDPLSRRYAVAVEPTMLVLRGGREVNRLVGRWGEAAHCAAYDDAVRGRARPGQQR